MESDLVKKWDVLGIGCGAVDDLLFVEAYPPADVKTRVQEAQRQGGGLTTTALVASARIGAKSAFGGQLGFDEYSNYTAEYLEREGVDLSACPRRAEGAPFHSVIIVDRTNNTRNIFSRQTGEVGSTVELPDAETIKRAKVLMMDHHSGAGKVRVARTAREAEIPIVTDVERSNVPDFEEFFELVDHPVLTYGFASARTGETEPKLIVRKLWSENREAVVVTWGGNGSWAFEGDEVVHYPAFPTQVVDTTGCGDTFHGVYAATLAWGWPMEERIRYASAAAALKARERGAQAGIPNRGKVEAFLKELG